MTMLRFVPTEKGLAMAPAILDPAEAGREPANTSGFWCAVHWRDFSVGV
jgi:hypothetical protein